MRRRCVELREVLRDSPELCTAEELAAYWPGGVENTLPAEGCWTYCFAIYTAFLMRSQARPDEAAEDAVERAKRDAFLERPITVELVTPNAAGQVQALTVYPKSYEALTQIDVWDDQARWFLERADYLGRRWDAEAVQRRGDAMQAAMELQLLSAWAVTTPGPLLPFNPLTEDPALPEVMRALTDLDLINLMVAHRKVNLQRNALVAESMRRGSGSSVRWTTLAVAASKVTGERVEFMLKHRSLGAWLLQAAETWEGARQEAEAAQAARAAPRGPAMEDL